jgi:DNA polymerase-1
LVQSYGSVEEILGNLAQLEVDPKIRGRAKIAETIRNDPAALTLSKRLVAIDNRTPITLPDSGTVVTERHIAEVLAALSVRTFDEQELYKLVSQFEFDSIIDARVIEGLRQRAGAPKAEVPETRAATQTVDAENYAFVLEEFAKQSGVAFDLETDSLNPHESKIIGASLCWSEAGPAYYFPFACNASPERAVPLEQFLTALKSFKGMIIGQNLKFDLEVLIGNGIVLLNPVWDTMLAAHLLNPERGSYNLTVLAREFLNRGVIEFSDLVQPGGTFADVPIERATEYGCQDAQIAWDLYKKLSPELDALGLTKTFAELEMPLVSVLAAMESRGLMVDELFLARLSDEFAGKLATLESQIYAVAGGAFNINSPKQLSSVLFDKLGLPTKGLKKTKTGVSTDASVLEKLAEQHPLPGLLLQYRGFFKLKSTYVDALPQSVSRKTRRIHCKLNQAGTATGRLSSSDPNLQNIPISTEEGRRIREAFIAPPGKKLLSADYSQIELRILAHMANDEAMQRTFAAGVDIHSATAREILGLGADAPVSAEQRRVGKTINFGIVYGMGPYRLARELGISIAEATRYIEGYFERFAGVRKFFDKVEHEANIGGCVVTLGGRKRFLSQISGEGRDPDFVRRAALNAPIQGSAADLMKRSMITIEELSRAGKLPGQLLLQVHDELLFEAQEGDVVLLEQLVKSVMEGAWKLSVPLVVAVGVGNNWDEAHS